MPKFIATPLVDDSSHETWRLGTGTGASNRYKDTEKGKAVKLVAESRYALCAAGDPIEGFIESVNVAPADDYSIGTVMRSRRREVLADGLQSTPGTGTIAIGDFVVAGTMVAKDTALTLTAPQKVCKATNQPGATVTSADNVVGNINAAIAKVVDAQNLTAKGLWKVVSLGSVGTGAVGTKILIERVNRA